jgi:hypothetical protein
MRKVEVRPAGLAQIRLAMFASGESKFQRWLACVASQYPAQRRMCPAPALLVRFKTKAARPFPLAVGENLRSGHSQPYGPNIHANPRDLHR